MADTNGKAKRAKKSADKPAEAKAVTTGQMIVQAHGGALRRGGTNKGGPGRPPSAIRAAMRESLDKRWPVLDLIAGSTSDATKDVDRIRAIDVLAKYGFGDMVSIDDVRKCLRETTEEIREFLSPEQAENLLQRIRPIWMSL